MSDPYFDQELVGSGLARSNRAALAINLAMPSQHGCSQVLIFHSDSTGREPSVIEGFPYIFAQRCAQVDVDYPDYAQVPPVVVQAWDPTNQVYGGKVNLNPAAEERHLLMLAGDGTARTRSLNNSEIGAFTDLDLIVDVALDTYTPAATTTVIAQWGSAGTLGHRLRITSGGNLSYQRSSDGTTQSASIVSTAALVLAGGTRRMLRVADDVDNGAGGNTVTFYHKAPSDDAWTQLGAPVVTTGTTSIFRPAARAFEVGGQGASTVYPGKYYGVEYRSGINGGFVSPQPIECWRGNEDKTVTGGEPTLYIFIGAQGGAGLNPTAGTATSGMLEVARWPKMVPLVDCMCTYVLNTGHNEIDNGPVWTALLDTWLAAERARLPHATVWVMTQSPRLNAQAPTHSRRM